MESKSSRLEVLEKLVKIVNESKSEKLKKDCETAGLLKIPDKSNRSSIKTDQRRSLDTSQSRESLDPVTDVRRSLSSVLDLMSKMLPDFKPRPIGINMSEDKIFESINRDLQEYLQKT